VRVDDPQMNLVCERLVADVPQAGGHVNHIVAETNVVIDFMDDKGHTNHATSDKAVYVYSEAGGVTNETVTLTGNPQMENVQGTLTGDVIVWDRLNNHLTASNQKMVFRQSLNGTAADTNPPVPVIKTTNFPPGTIQNIDTIIQ
jgi:lipopolysaccharide export system protein LptA